MIGVGNARSSASTRGRRAGVVIALVAALGACSSSSSHASSGGNGATSGGTAGNGGGSSSAGNTSSGGGGSPTCKQITKAMVQPLVDQPLTGVKVSVPPQTTLNKPTGQECVFSTSDTSDAMTIVVDSGSNGTAEFQADAASFGGDPVTVPGIGDRAIREGGDGTSEVSSTKGSEYCAVTPQSDGVPGADKLMQEAGDSSAIGDKAYAIIAEAAGTLCNRVYGSGNTTPDLSGLASIHVTTTTSALGLQP